MSELYEGEELDDQLKKCPEWEADGDEISRTIEFEDYMEGVDFVNTVAEMAEDAQHHPELHIRYQSVTAILSTHEAGGVTSLDIEMAQRIDNLVD